MKTYNLIQEYLSLNKYKFLEKIPDSEDYLYVDCFCKTIEKNEIFKKEEYLRQKDYKLKK